MSERRGRREEGSSDQIFVEEIEYESGQSAVVPVSMHQQESDQELEAGHGKVAGHDRLHALPPSDADTHVCLLDHAHVIGTITNGQGHLA